MPVFCNAVGFEFFFKNERVVIAVQVPGGAAHHVGGSVVDQGDGLFDALVLGAVNKGQGAVRRGPGGVCAVDFEGRGDAAAFIDRKPLSYKLMGI